MSVSATRLPCPREDCLNSLDDPTAIVCAADFHVLASTCRGKKRLGEPEAATIEGMGRGPAYECVLCKQWHNGAKLPDRAAFKVRIRATVRALREDPRVGWRGILNLADAWHPSVSERARWREGLDQRVAYA